MIWNIVLIISIVILGFILCTYNTLIKLENKVKETESGIDILLKQRFDLIPNLVESIKGYTEHEETTLEEITKLRNHYEQNKDFNVQEIDQIDMQFHHLVAVVEAYPNLKANDQFLQLFNTLTEIENDIEMSRIRYNQAVTNYNNKVEVIPSNIVAKMCFFKVKELFKIEEKEKQNIKINLTNQ